MNSPLASPLIGVVTAVPPAAGKSTVTGVILSAASNVPLSEVSVYLAPVYRQDGNAAYILDTASSPSTLTNATGQFIAKDIAPGEYVVVIGDPSASYAILNEPSDEAKVWKVDANAVLDIGMHSVTLR
jgi:hypothetical protein